MKTIGPEEVHAALSYPALVDALQETFSGEFNMPPATYFSSMSNQNLTMPLPSCPLGILT